MRKLAVISLLLALFFPSPCTRGEGQGEGSTQSMNEPRFEFMDIYIDPHGKPLAAYQFELSVDPSAASIVGVEGGEHPAFTVAPYYDPNALSKNRIVIAAFNTGSDLPHAKTRVARLHMRVMSPHADYQLRLDTAAGSDGVQFNAAASFEKGTSQ